MKIDVGQTVNTLANVGVLVGIVFLAIEVSPNQATLEEQTTLNALSGRDASDRFRRCWEVYRRAIRSKGHAAFVDAVNSN